MDPTTVLDDPHALRNFHRKYNKALSEKLVVENERNRLRAEKDQLMLLLKQVQDGLVVNDEVLAKSNPLFVVNGRSSVLARELPVERAAAEQVEVAAAAEATEALAV